MLQLETQLLYSTVAKHKVKQTTVGVAKCEFCE